MENGNFMRYVIFDLDATVIDSSHRQITKSDGSLDLAAWKKNSTYDAVMRDSLLPLARHWKTIQEKKNVFIAVCTARFMSEADFDFLKFRGLKANQIMSRAFFDHRPDHLMKRTKILAFMVKHKITNPSKITFYDDNQNVLEMLNVLGVKAKDSIKINQELSA